jgi:hypothetical protein
MERDVANACLESFVLHTRNLIDFLYPPEKPRPVDILAGDYFSGDSEW